VWFRDGIERELAPLLAVLRSAAVVFAMNETLLVPDLVAANNARSEDHARFRDGSSIVCGLHLLVTEDVTAGIEEFAPVVRHWEINPVGSKILTG